MKNIDLVYIGADTIASNGAVINKIGTFTAAVVAKEHKIPFFVAAPESTFDLAHTSADVIIEERIPTEVTHFGGKQVATRGVEVINPAFDITPLDYVSAIVCEKRIYRKEDFPKFKKGRLPG
jgi:methylthioribose-1-phosphate isomerase